MPLAVADLDVDQVDARRTPNSGAIRAACRRRPVMPATCVPWPYRSTTSGGSPAKNPPRRQRASCRSRDDRRNRSSTTAMVTPWPSQVGRLFHSLSAPMARLYAFCRVWCICKRWMLSKYMDPLPLPRATLKADARLSAPGMGVRSKLSLAVPMSARAVPHPDDPERGPRHSRPWRHPVRRRHIGFNAGQLVVAPQTSTSQTKAPDRSDCSVNHDRPRLSSQPEGSCATGKKIPQLGHRDDGRYFPDKHRHLRPIVLNPACSPTKGTGVSAIKRRWENSSRQGVQRGWRWQVGGFGIRNLHGCRSRCFGCWFGTHKADQGVGRDEFAKYRIPVESGNNRCRRACTVCQGGPPGSSIAETCTLTLPVVETPFPPELTERSGWGMAEVDLADCAASSKLFDDPPRRQTPVRRRAQ